MNIRFLFAYVPSSAWIQEHETVCIGNVILFPGFNSVNEICCSFEMSIIPYEVEKRKLNYFHCVWK